MDNEEALAVQSLAARVFGGQERWGWEYAEPAAPRPHPRVGIAPPWLEPDWTPLARRAASRSDVAKPIKWLLLCSPLPFLCVPYGIVVSGLMWVVALCLAAAYLIQTHLLSRVRRSLESAHQQSVEQHRNAFARWQLDIAMHDMAERRRVEMAPRWFPVRLTSAPGRVDVIGGTGNGWASLLTTVAGPLLTNGQAIVVADFSQQAVGRELAWLTAFRGIAVNRSDLPGQLADADLGQGFSPTELAESLAAAISTMRPSDVDISLRHTDVELLRTVLDCLEGSFTPARLAAGLTVLLRGAEDPTRSLSVQETAALSAAIDDVGRSERVQEELRFLRGTLDLLSQAAADRAPVSDPTNWWRAGQLTLLVCDDFVERRKDLTDRIVFHRLLHHLRKGRFAAGSGLLVVVGADHLGRDALESMSRHARTAGVRLVVFMEHLREDIQDTVGGSDSATVLMRLGNSREAEAAAAYIGRGYKFLVNQVTQQSGSTVTDGRSSSYGEQTGRTHTSGTGPNSSSSTSLSQSWQDSTNTSLGLSTTAGTTTSRLYEFTVEPTQLQAMPATSFLLVEGMPHGRRVVHGDCAPIAPDWDQVSNEPLMADGHG
ncbi:hypothetical protein OG782_00040 [Streptomyces sp. NBC_00876]|uniref:hypothetical protein n=1 Tax=Streptomyces sp. NBC_00876 TaxID=2975853 RepID=UPI003868E48B|nr:hypothetical protein OG782_00040 [Streptomyces sp. NBC_00876]